MKRSCWKRSWVLALCLALAVAPVGATQEEEEEEEGRSFASVPEDKGVAGKGGGKSALGQEESAPSPAPTPAPSHLRILSRKKRQRLDGFQFSDLFRIFNSGLFDFTNAESFTRAVKDDFVPSSPGQEVADEAHHDEHAGTHADAGAAHPEGAAAPQLLQPGLPQVGQFLQPGLQQIPQYPYPYYPYVPPAYPYAPPFAPYPGYFPQFAYPPAVGQGHQAAQPAAAAAAAAGEHGDSHAMSSSHAPHMMIQSHVPHPVMMPIPAHRPMTMHASASHGHPSAKRSDEVQHTPSSHSPSHGRGSQQHAEPHVRQPAPSFFHGYRQRIQRRQHRRNWFRRMMGKPSRRRFGRDVSRVEAATKKTLSRSKRGIMDVLQRMWGGKEIVGVLDRMMAGTDDSLYPYTRAALMGYTGSTETCEHLYPECPTTMDELIDTFNNLRSHFPNGVPFRDRIPAPFRYLIP